LKMTEEQEKTEKPEQKQLLNYYENSSYLQWKQYLIFYIRKKSWNVI